MNKLECKQDVWPHFAFWLTEARTKCTLQTQSLVLPKHLYQNKYITLKQNAAGITINAMQRFTD